MSEVAQIQAPHRAWDIFRRVLVAVALLLAVIGLIITLAGVIGLWVVRGPARDAVTAVTTALNSQLGRVNQALRQVSAAVDQGRQALTAVDDATNNAGGRVDALTSAVRDKLAPKIAAARMAAGTLRDGAVAVNATLETLNNLPFITVPTLTDELSALSDRVEAAQSDVQDLRATIAEARAGVSADLKAAVTTRTSRIDAGLAQIQAVATKYQAAATQRQQQVTDLANTLLGTIDLLVVTLTVLLLVFAVGQALLIYICWQYVRTGRFPSLRVARA
jgi:uncharacterized protein YukE